jgi:hypothetical protein
MNVRTSWGGRDPTAEERHERPACILRRAIDNPLQEGKEPIMSKHPLVMLRALPEDLESIAELALDLRWTWVNSSDRLWKMLEYVEILYLPATKTYRKRAAKDESLVKQLLAWQAALEQHWPSIRFGEVRITHEGGLWRFLVSVY